MRYDRFNAKIKQLDVVYDHLLYYFNGMDYSQSIIDDYFKNEGVNRDLHLFLENELDLNSYEWINSKTKLVNFVKKYYVGGFYYRYAKLDKIRKHLSDKTSYDVLDSNDNYHNLLSIIHDTGLICNGFKTMVFINDKIKLKKPDKSELINNPYSYIKNYKL